MRKTAMLYVLALALLVIGTITTSNTMPQGFAPAIQKQTPQFPQPGCIPGTDPKCPPPPQR